MEFTAEMIAGFLGGSIEGDRSAKVSTIAKIEEGAPGALSFLANMKYEHHIYTTGSSIVIVNSDFEPRQAVNATLIRVDDAYGSFAKLLELYVANKPRKSGISKSASIDESAVLGEGCYVGEFAVVSPGVKAGMECMIYPQVYLGDNVVLGDRVVLHPGVKIYEDCVVGSDVVIHAGSVIGADGFGFAPGADGVFGKIPQIGNVVIGDGVEIGANTCVDRATMGSTRIGRGVKLDNLIQIGHNVTLGDNTVCAAQAGIAGSSTLGANCMLGGQVGIVGHITLGDRVQVGSKAGVAKNIDSDERYMGYPALPMSRFQRVNIVWRNLPELSVRVDRMEKDIKNILDPQQ